MAPLSESFLDFHKFIQREIEKVSGIQPFMFNEAQKRTFDYLSESNGLPARLVILKTRSRWKFPTIQDLMRFYAPKPELRRVAAQRRHLASMARRRARRARRALKRPVPFVKCEGHGLVPYFCSGSCVLKGH